jgi:hypothetical protein
MASVSHTVLLKTNHPIDMVGFFAHIFDLSFEEMRGVSGFYIGGLKLVLCPVEKGDGHCLSNEKNFVVEVEIDEEDSLDDFLMKARFYYFRNPLSEKEGSLLEVQWDDVLDRSFIELKDPDGRTWRVAQNQSTKERNFTNQNQSDNARSSELIN